MAKEKQPTHTVAHGNLYLSVGGKLQHVPAGTPVILTAEQAEKASADIYKPIKSDAEAIELGKPEKPEKQ